MGATYRSNNDGLEIDSQKLIRHERFDFPTTRNDIALIKLKQSWKKIGQYVIAKHIVFCHLNNNTRIGSCNVLCYHILPCQLQVVLE